MYFIEEIYGIYELALLISIYFQLLGSYPLVAKSLRDISHGHGGHAGHCCGMTLKEHGLGYPDLDELMKAPEPLEFILGIHNND